jgi:hypothetical protein
MLNIDRVWSRVSQLKQYQGRKLSDFVLQQITFTSQMTSAQALANQVVLFPAGSIVVGIRAGATIDSAAGTQTQRDGLDQFKLSIADQQTARTIVGTAQALASAVFGRYGDQCPAKELIIPAQGGLIYSFTNLTTSTIDFSVTHDCLVPGAVG